MKHFDNDTRKILIIGLIGIVIGLCYLLYMIMCTNPFLFIVIFKQ